MKRLLLVTLSVAALASCSDRPEPVAIEPSFRALPSAGARGVTVISRNIYIGTNVDPIIAAQSPEEFAAAAATAWAVLQLTNFTERAEALADEVAATNPHLVGLQEVALYRTSALADPTPPSTVAFDFLSLLLDALAARGLSYAVVSEVAGTDLAVPNVVDGINVRFTDRDVILARSDVTTWNAQGANFTARIPLTVLGQPAGSLVRSWASVMASAAGNTFRFVSTHLEVQAAQVIQVLQAQELLAMLAAAPTPVVLVGDFNSAADGSQTPTYGMITSAGYVDSWSQRYPRDPGFTCCHSVTLMNPVPNLDQRIDIIFTSGLSGASGQIVGGVHADIVGDEPDDRTASGLWPSDHAGVVVTLSVPPTQAVASR